MIDLLGKAFDGVVIFFSHSRVLPFVDFRRRALLQACPANELLPHQREDLFLIEIDRQTRLTETVVDDREKHAQADEDDQHDEQTETEWTEEGCRVRQIRGVEFQQGHFEQHLRRLKETLAGVDLRDEEKVEETEKGHEDHGEHQRERNEFSRGIAQRLAEQRQALIVLTETKESNRPEETTVGQEKVQGIVHIGRQL